jgi:aspartate/glutamate racemase
LTQSEFFENLLKSNQTLLPNDNLFFTTFSTSMKIYKKLLMSGSICFMVPNKANRAQVRDRIFQHLLNS